MEILDKKTLQDMSKYYGVTEWYIKEKLEAMDQKQIKKAINYVQKRIAEGGK